MDGPKSIPCHGGKVTGAPSAVSRWTTSSARLAPNTVWAETAPGNAADAAKISALRRLKVNARMAAVAEGLVCRFSAAAEGSLGNAINHTARLATDFKVSGDDEWAVRERPYLDWAAAPLESCRVPRRGLARGAKAGAHMGAVTKRLILGLTAPT